MLTIIGALFPVFGLIAMGFCLGRTRVLGAQTEHQLTRFVATVTLPVLTFHTIAGMDPADLAAPVMASVVVGSSWLLYAVYFTLERLAGREPAQANIVALGGCYGNSAFVGLPICLALFGQGALAPSALVMALNTAFVFGGAIFMQVFFSSAYTAGAGIRAAVRQIGTNPLVLGALAGVAVSVLRLRLPQPLDSLMTTLGGATPGCALIAIGLFVARPLERGVGAPVVRASVAKLLVLPAITLALIVILPPLPPVWSAVALVMASVPTASSTFIIASTAGVRSAQLAATLVTTATVAAVVTIPFVIFAVNRASAIAMPFKD